MGVTDAIGYAWGQCTWFVSQALSQVNFARVGNLGDAKNWYGAAQAKGIPVSQTPSLGAAVVYNGNYPGSQGYGHVGVVTAINPNGTFQVASDNWGGVGITHIGTSTMNDVIGFIPAPSQSLGIVGAQRALEMAHGSAGSYVVPASVTGGVPSQPQQSSGYNFNPLDSNNNIGQTIVDWSQRASLVVFGGLILLVGLIVLFTMKPSDVSGAAGSVIGEEGEPERTETTGQTTTEKFGPRGGKKGKTVETRTRTVPAKKGSGIKGKVSKAGKAAAVAAV